MKKVSTLTNIAVLNSFQQDIENEMMDHISRSPRKSSIRNILNYSKAVEIKESNYIDSVETILN